MFIRSDTSARVSSNPHSVATARTVEIPDSGNPFVARQKAFMAAGLQGGRGMGALASWQTTVIAIAALIYFMPLISKTRV